MTQPTIYEALKSALGREPTNAEINAKCRAIIAEGNPKRVTDMDAANNSTRKFPGFTLAGLETALLSEALSPEMRAKIEAEVSARKAGKSVVYAVPQVERAKQRREVSQMRRQF